MRIFSKRGLELPLNLFLKTVPNLDNLDNGLDWKSPSSSGVHKTANGSILEGVLIGWRQVRTGDICFIFLVTSSLSPLSGHVCLDVDLLRVDQRSEIRDTTAAD